jgi:hypothetical protein
MVTRTTGPRGRNMARSGFWACSGRPCSGPRLAWTPPPGGCYGLEGRVRDGGGLNPRAKTVELFVDRLPDRCAGFVDMDLDVAGTPGEASGDFECPVPERQATPELTGRCCHEGSRGMGGMEKICGEQAQEEKGFVFGKARGGVAPFLGLSSQTAALHAVGGGQGDLTRGVFFRLPQPLWFWTHPK